MAEGEFIQLGQISGVFGIKGWIKVFSDTRPRESIFSYSPWWIETKDGWREYKVKTSRSQGKGLVAELEGLDDRDQAALLTNCSVAVKAEQLPLIGQDEFYWADLIGLEVVNRKGHSFGKVFELLETGAHDVLSVSNESGDQILIPFVLEVYILNIDLKTGRIEVDWEQDYSV